MGRPLRVLNTSDLAEMSDAEIKGRIVPLILDKFAQEAGTSLRGNIHLNTGHDLSGGIGNGSNTIRNNDVGYHGSNPTAFSTANFSFTQRIGANSSAPTWPVNWEGSGVIHEMNSTKLKTDILRCCAEVWRQTGTSTGVGSYFFGTGIPNLGGTWAHAGTLDSLGFGYGGGTGTVITSINETHRLLGTDSNTTYYLFRKYADSGSSSSTLSSGNAYIPCKTSTESGVAGNIRQMTDADVETLVNEWRNFLLADQGTIGSTVVGTIGSYQLTTSSSAPSGGTWTQMGSFVDKIADVSSSQYANQFTGYSSQLFSQQYTGNFQRNYSGQFRTHYGNYGGARYSPYYTGYASQLFSQQYTGNFQRNYSAQYTGYFAGDTIQASQSSTTYYLWRRIG